MTEMAANDIENNRYHSVLSPSQMKSSALNFSTVMEANGAFKSMLVVNLFWPRVLYLPKCGTFSVTEHGALKYGDNSTP